MATADIRFYHGRPAPGAWDADRSSAGLLDHIGALALFAVIFSGFIASFDYSREIVVAGGMLVLTAVIVFRASGQVSNTGIIFAGLALVMYAMTMLFYQSSTIDVNYYIAPIIGLGAYHIKPKVLTYYIIGILCLQILAQIYEWWTGSFIYYAVGKYDLSVFNEEVLAGSAGVFRSKGFFEASSVLGATLIYFCAMTRLNTLVCVLAVAICVLGYARLGLVMCSGMLLLSISRGVSKRVLIVAIVGAVVFLAVGYDWLASVIGNREYSSDFLASTLDADSSWNMDRIESWFGGLSFLGTMSPSELLFGAYDRFIAEVGSVSVENAWMNILGIAGLVVFGLYLVGCFFFTSRDYRSLSVQGIIFLAGMFAATFQSLATCALFWAAAFASSRPIRNKVGRPQ